MNYNCSIFWDLRNLQEQVKKAFCNQKLFWPFTVWINCSSDLKNFANSQPSASNFKSFSQSLEQFFFTVVQNNLVTKHQFCPDIELFSCLHVWKKVRLWHNLTKYDICFVAIRKYCLGRMEWNWNSIQTLKLHRVRNWKVSITS